MIPEITATPLSLCPGVVLLRRSDAGIHIRIEVPNDMTVEQVRELALVLQQITADEP